MTGSRAWQWTRRWAPSGGILLAAACLWVACAWAAGARVNPSRVTLAWDPPTVNEDGSPCDDLAGYILAATSQEVADLNAGGTILQTVTVTGSTYQLVSFSLTDGPARFWVRAVDLAGNESAWSEPLDLELDAKKPGKPGKPRKD